MYRVWLRWVALPEFARDECLSCQSQPSLFRAKESPLKKEIIQQENNSGSQMCREIPCKKSCFLLAGSLLNEFERKGSIFCFHITKGFGCPLGPPAWLICLDSVRASSVSRMATKGGKTMQNVYSNLYSQAVTHPSTNRSQPCLTSVIGRELVYSRWYGRRHQSRGKILMQKSKNDSGTKTYP